MNTEKLKENYEFCTHCESLVTYQPEDVHIDYCYGGNLRYMKCPYCGKDVIVNYETERWIREWQEQ